MNGTAVIAALVVLGAGPDSISNDRLCKAIGETPNVAVPPRDRAFFQDHCECSKALEECAHKGGARAKKMWAASKCKLDVFGAVLKELDEPGGNDFLDIEVDVERQCFATGSLKKTLAVFMPGLREKAAERARSEKYAEDQRKEQAEREERERKEVAAREAMSEQERAKADAEREAALGKDKAEFQKNGPSVELLEEALTKARLQSGRDAFIESCARYIFMNTPQGSTFIQFVPFCDCAYDGRADGLRQSRNACRSKAVPSE